MTQSSPSVHPDLRRHQASMTPQVYTLRNFIHCAFGYTIVNCTLIEGDDACILVDTMTGMDNAETVAAEFRKITEKPIRTIIYTHFHADHVSGAPAFVPLQDIQSGKTEVIAQQSLVQHVARDVGLIAPILGRRAFYQFGMRLPVGEEGTVGAGMGPPQRPGRRTFVPPTRTFDTTYRGETGGIRFEIHHIPSETEDQCAVWLPDFRVLLSADAIYESFPNIYALRGTRFRDPMEWAQGLDRLRSFEADILVPHHGRPVEGRERIAELLTDYRDAIQFLHDQTLRYMNKGYRPEEIADIVVMPERLRDHPWLGEYYGSYKHAIPAIYAGYLGWYQGDPVTLDPVPWAERGQRYVEMMGGREAVLARARDALASNDPKWAADILTWVIRADTTDQEARILKSDALRRWAYEQKNAIWRNWGLTSALELDGRLDLAAGGMALGSPDQVRGFALTSIMKVLTVRLKAEECMDMHFCVAFETTDSGEHCALEIRRGVCQFHETPPSHPDAAVRFDRAFLLDWVFGRTTLDEAIAGNRIVLEGNATDVNAFLEAFEPFNQTDEVSITAR